MTSTIDHNGSRGQGLVTASDRLPGLSVPEHVKEKEFPIERMCDIFNRGMQKKWDRRYYVDLFSGPGRCVIRGSGEEVEGSPILAAKSQVPFTDYFFSDKSLPFLEALRKRVDNLNLTESLQFSYYHGDANSVVSDLVANLPVAETSLGLAVLDSWGWDYSFETLSRLTEGRRLDLVINFPIVFIKRNWQRELPQLDKFMNSRRYRKSFENAMTREKPGLTPTRVLLDFYGEELKGIDYKYIDDHVEVKNSLGLPQYYLIFASKNERGADFWEKVTRRQESGQIRML